MAIIHMMAGHFKTKQDLRRAFDAVRDGNTVVILDGRSLNVSVWPFKNMQDLSESGKTSSNKFDASKLRLVIQPVSNSNGMPVGNFCLKKCFPKDIIQVANSLNEGDFVLLRDGHDKDKLAGYAVETQFSVCAVTKQFPVGTQMKIVLKGEPTYSRELRIVG